MASRRLVERPAFRITATATFALLAPFASPPHAQASDSPWYLGLQVPVMFIDDTESRTTGSNMIQDHALPYSAKATSEYKAGFKIAGMVGYRLGRSLRVEGELFFARARVDRQTYGSIVSAGNPVPVKVNVPISGSASQAGATANVWFDIPTDSDWPPMLAVALASSGWTRAIWNTTPTRWRTGSQNCRTRMRPIFRPALSRRFHRPIPRSPGISAPVSATGSTTGRSCSSATACRLRTTWSSTAGTRSATAST